MNPVTGASLLTLGVRAVLVGAWLTVAEAEEEHDDRANTAQCRDQPPPTGAARVVKATHRHSNRRKQQQRSNDNRHPAKLHTVGVVGVGLEHCVKNRSNHTD